MKKQLLAGLACIALASCTAKPSESWHDFTQRSIGKWMELDPSFAVYEGAHQFDGKLPDWSEEGLKARTQFLVKLIQDAGTYRDLKDSEKFERDYLVQTARGELFWITEADEPHHNPDWYLGSLDPNVYVTREYAPKPERMKAMISFFEAIPQAAKNIQANLKTPLPASFVKLGVAGFGGFAEYYAGDARAAFADVKDPALQEKFMASSEKAAKAMADLRDWMKSKEATATQDFALGPDRFASMLKETEAVDVPLDELEKAGRADLERNRKAAVEACAQYAPGAAFRTALRR